MKSSSTGKAGSSFSFSSQEFSKKILAQEELKKLPLPTDDIVFGRTQTDHMLVCDFLADKGGWQKPQITPYAPFSFSPDSVVFHYGQQIFEGMKVYKDAKLENIIHLFRPDLNAKRFFNSAVRLGMEPVPEQLFLDCVKEIVATEARWILPSPGSLYVRPALIPLDEGVSYRASANYRFFIVVSPAKDYYANPFGVSVAIERSDVRAAVGGVGEAKCGGNYASALAALKRAQLSGAEQVLWLDSVEKRFVEEVGAMNIFFVYKEKIETPLLSGSILPGVTRASLLEMIPEVVGLPVVERRIDIDEVLKNAKQGSLLESFGCGTAAVISTISNFQCNGEITQIAKVTKNSAAQKLKDQLVGIQTGLLPDFRGWRTTIKV